MKEEGYMTQWLDKLRADALAPNKVAADRVIQEQRARAFGLAWMDSAHLDAYAIEAGLPPETLRKALATEGGTRIAVAAECKLRASGEADRVLASWLNESLLDVIKNVLAAGTLSETTAGKLLDTFSKGKGNAAAVTQPMIPPSVYRGSVAALVAEILAVTASPDAVEKRIPK